MVLMVKCHFMSYSICSLYLYIITNGKYCLIRLNNSVDSILALQVILMTYSIKFFVVELR